MAEIRRLDIAPSYEARARAGAIAAGSGLPPRPDGIILQASPETRYATGQVLSPAVVGFLRGVGAGLVAGAFDTLLSVSFGFGWEKALISGGIATLLTWAPFFGLGLVDQRKATKL